MRRSPRLAALLLWFLLLSTPSGAQYLWQQLPGPEGGVPVLFTSYPRDGALYTVTTGHLAYASSDSGATWTPLRFPDPGASVLTMIAGRGGRLYASVAGRGVMVSEGGTQWLQRNEGLTVDPQGATITRYALDAAENLYGLGREQVYRFDETANAWTAIIHLPTDATVTALAVGPDSTVYIGTASKGVLRAEPGGTWSSAGPPLPGKEVRHLVVDPGGVLFAGGFGLFRSEDRGEHWKRMAPSPDSLAAVDYLESLQGGVGASLGGRAFRSDDHGAHWRSLGPYTGYARTAVFEPTILDGWTAPTGVISGVGRSTDGGTTWRRSDAGIVSRQVSSLAISRTGALLAATDLGLYRSTNIGGSWDRIAIDSTRQPLGRFIVLRSGRTLLYNTNGDIYLSDTGGERWTTHKGSFISLDGMVGLPDSTLIALGSAGGERAFYRSTNEGREWTKILGHQYGYATFSAVLHPSGAIVVSGGDGIWRFVPDGEIYRADGFTPGSLQISSMVVDPAGVLYAGVAHGTPGGVISSTDEGRTWMPMNVGLVDTLVTALHADSAGLWAGVGPAAYRWNPLSGRWQEIDYGMRAPNLWIHSFARYPDGPLLAGTDARGIYRIDQLPPLGVTEERGARRERWMTSEIARGMVGVRLALPGRAEGAVHLVDISGRQVASLFEGMLEAGETHLSYDLSVISSGAYLLTLQAGAHRESIPVFITR